MAEIDKNDVLKDNPFSYKSSKEKVLISYEGKMIMVLKGKKAEALLKKIVGKSGIEEQLILAKITGNFKRGNEKQNKNIK